MLPWFLLLFQAVHLLEQTIAPLHEALALLLQHDVFCRWASQCSDTAGTCRREQNVVNGAWQRKHPSFVGLGCGPGAV